MKIRLLTLAGFLTLLLCLSACTVPQTITPIPQPVPATSAKADLSKSSLAPRINPPTATIRPQLTCTACTWKPTPATPTSSSTSTPVMRTATVKVEKLDVWDDPANENSYWHRQTQLITGEQVLIVSDKNEWTQIVASQQPSSQDERGYPGWVRANGLAVGLDKSSADYLVVIARSSVALAAPQPGADRLLRLYLDTRLPVVTKNSDLVEAALPDGRQAWLPIEDVNLHNVNDLVEPFPTGAIIITAGSLANAPYMWGGTTPDSPDCSGFIYRLFHAYGISPARDANDQVLQGQLTTFDLKQAGDLIFYSDVSGGPVTHVGLYMGGNQIMDANPFLGLTIHPVSDMQKWYVFYSVRRFSSSLNSSTW